MTIKPLGPDGIQARIAEIQSRMNQIFPKPAAQMPEVTITQPKSELAPMNALPPGADALAPLADQIAEENGLDSGLFRALVQAESSWNPAAVSPKGAMGLTQLMPATARGLGVGDPLDPIQNLQGGAKYLKSLLDQFGSPELALAAYNAGPGAVRRFGGIPPFAETQAYVRRIMGAAR
jgi:soluble lytic murein transglycosylase-like protein